MAGATNPTIPTLRTTRLVLEPLSWADSAGMYTLWSDPAVCEFSGVVRDYDGQLVPTPVVSIADSDRIIDFWIRAVADGWGFRWAVKLDAGFAGTVGFNSLGDCAEIAYHLCPAYWGAGIMREASAAAINWVQARGTTTIEAFIEPDNGPSIALAERLGLTATPAFSDGAQRYVLLEVALSSRGTLRVPPRTPPASRLCRAGLLSLDFADWGLPALELICP